MDRTPALRIVQWNVRGIRTRHPDLLQFIAVAQPHVLVLCETWLKPLTIFKLQGFSLVRMDRPSTTTTGGGVAIAIRNDIPFRPLPLPPSTYEAVAVQLLLPSVNLALLSLYLPPAQPAHAASGVGPFLPSIPPPFILGGDFNAKHSAWVSPIDNEPGLDLFDLLVVNQGLHLLNADVRKTVAERNNARRRAYRSLSPADTLAYRKAYARARYVIRDLCTSLTNRSSLSWVWRMAKGRPPPCPHSPPV